MFFQRNVAKNKILKLLREKRTCYIAAASDSVNRRGETLDIVQGCQVGLFEARYKKFCLFFKQLALKFLNIYYVVGLFFKSRLI